MALDSYVKTAWVNDSTPAINANNLNKIEQGIYDINTETRNLDNAINESSLLKFIRGIIIGGSAGTSDNYVRTDYYYATKGTTITVSPIDFGLAGMGIYYYSQPDEAHFVSSDSISSTAAGGTTVYTISQNTYFRLRAAKTNTPNLTDAEVAKFSLYFTLNTFISSVMLKKNITEESEKILNRIFTNDLMQFVRGIILGGIAQSSNNYVRTDYYYATKGSTITVSPIDFGLDGLAIYFYNGADETEYDTGESISATAAGATTVYTFSRNGYFRLRAAKTGYPNLTDAEVAKFSLYFTLNSLESNKEFVNISKEICSLPIADINSLSEKAYFPNEWKSRLEELHFEIGNCFAFGIQTDTHVSLFAKSANGNNYPAMTKEDITPFKMLTNYVGLDFIANLGDIIRGREFDSYSEAQESYTEIINRYIENVSCPVLFTIGNHDDDGMWTVDINYGGHNTLDEVIKPSEQYAILMKPLKNTSVGIINPSKEMYYYKDFDNVRVIVLNSRDVAYQTLSNSDVNVNHHEISSGQRQWLEDIALNTDKPVLIFSHVSLVSNLRDQAATFDGATETYDIIKNFKSNGGTVVGAFCGHIHRQDSATVDGILNVAFANGARFAEIVIVDTDNKTIETKMVGNYGSKTDRSFTYS